MCICVIENMYNRLRFLHTQKKACIWELDIDEAVESAFNTSVSIHVFILLPLVLRSLSKKYFSLLNNTDMYTILIYRKRCKHMWTWNMRDNGRLILHKSLIIFIYSVAHSFNAVLKKIFFFPALQHRKFWHIQMIYFETYRVVII